jgi:hypothetical protein
MSDDSNPFASPQTISPAVPGTVYRAGGPIFPYASGRTRATFAIAGLALHVVVAICAIAINVQQLGIVERIGHGEQLSQEEAAGIEQLAGLSAVATLTIFVATVVAFLMWFHRAHRNLRALGMERPTYSPGWAVGGFFVPFLNLWRPCQVMSEVCRGSNSAVTSATQRRHGAGRGTPLVGLWWAFWLLMNMSAQFSTRLPTATLNEIRRSLNAQTFSEVVTVIAAVFTILLVRWVETNQDRRHELCQQAAEATPGRVDSSDASQNPWDPGFAN